MPTATSSSRTPAATTITGGEKKRSYSNAVLDEKKAFLARQREEDALNEKRFGKLRSHKQRASDTNISGNNNSNASPTKKRASASASASSPTNNRQQKGSISASSVGSPVGGGKGSAAQNHSPTNLRGVAYQSLRPDFDHFDKPTHAKKVSAKKKLNRKPDDQTHHVLKRKAMDAVPPPSAMELRARSASRAGVPLNIDEVPVGKGINNDGTLADYLEDTIGHQKEELVGDVHKIRLGFDEDGANQSAAERRGPLIDFAGHAPVPDSHDRLPSTAYDRHSTEDNHRNTLADAQRSLVRHQQEDKEAREQREREQLRQRHYEQQNSLMHHNATAVPCNVVGAATLPPHRGGAAHHEHHVDPHADEKGEQMISFVQPEQDKKAASSSGQDKAKDRSVSAAAPALQPPPSSGRRDLPYSGDASLNPITGAYFRDGVNGAQPNVKQMLKEDKRNGERGIASTSSSTAIPPAAGGGGGGANASRSSAKAVAGAPSAPTAAAAKKSMRDEANVSASAAPAPAPRKKKDAPSPSLQNAKASKDQQRSVDVHPSAADGQKKDGKDKEGKAPSNGALCCAGGGSDEERAAKAGKEALKKKEKADKEASKAAKKAAEDAEKLKAKELQEKEKADKKAAEEKEKAKKKAAEEKEKAKKKAEEEAKKKAAAAAKK